MPVAVVAPWEAMLGQKAEGAAADASRRSVGRAGGKFDEQQVSMFASLSMPILFSERAKEHSSLPRQGHANLLCAHDTRTLTEDLAILCKLIDQNGSTGVRAVCGLQSSLLIVNLLQLAK